ncbi:MAG: hypothetical protein V1806_07250 [Pseudomonadota bacterium]
MSKIYMTLLALLVLVGSFIGGALSGRIMGQTAQAEPSKLVTEQGIQLVDDQGRLRAEIAFRNVDGSLQPGFFLYGENGKERAAMMTLPPNGQPAMALSDASGFQRLWLGLGQMDAPLVALYDRDKLVRAAMGALTLRNQTTGQAEVRPVSSLTLMNESGRVGWVAP